MILAELDTNLLAIVASMIGAGVATLRWLMTRTDKLWEWMRTEEADIHQKILAALASLAISQKEIAETQLEILRLLRRQEEAKK